MERRSINQFGQPIGEPLGDWSPPPPIGADALVGRTTRLEPLVPDRHTSGLWTAFADAPESLWTYLTIGPFADIDEFSAAIDTLAASPDLRPFVVHVDGRPVGFACYLNIEPDHGVAEIGWIAFAPALQRTTAATEALVLMISHLFELGYRRCEWKCDDLNAPSRAAAIRLGFTYEGTFRAATHYKGRNRDTAWFSIIDSEWPALKTAAARWLASDNFDEHGDQRRSLEQFR